MKNVKQRVRERKKNYIGRLFNEHFQCFSMPVCVCVCRSFGEEPFVLLST